MIETMLTCNTPASDFAVEVALGEDVDEALPLAPVNCTLSDEILIPVDELVKVTPVPFLHKLDPGAPSVKLTPAHYIISDLFESKT
jgi:hypothetical protein